MKRAKTSLPVPVSPVSRTVTSVRATRAQVRRVSTRWLSGPNTRPEVDLAGCMAPSTSCAERAIVRFLLGVWSPGSCHPPSTSSGDSLRLRDTNLSRGDAILTGSYGIYPRGSWSLAPPDPDVAADELARPDDHPWTSSRDPASTPCRRRLRAPGRCSG